MTKPEAHFHSKLYDKLDDYIKNEDTPFDDVKIEKRTEEGTQADIIIESYLTADFVIEVKRDDKYLLDKEYINQAKEYADSENCELFALCTSDDFFLFDYKDDAVSISDIDWYWLDISDANTSDRTMGGIIPTILHSVEFIYENERLPEQKEKVEVTGLLKPFFNSMWKIYKGVIREEYGKNVEFSEKFEIWVEKNDIDGDDTTQDDIFENVAKQYSYLLVNRILFYDVLRRKTNEAGLSPLHKDRGSSKKIGYEGIFPRMNYMFGQVTEKIDYEPIFESDSELFISIPDDKKTAQVLVSEFVSNIESKKVMEFDEDMLGDIYEELIPEDERKELGQFYTPTDVAETIAKWTLDGLESPKVLDPACGSGTFCVESYKYMNDSLNMSHKEILNSIEYVDINNFPLQLTSFNLSRMDFQNPVNEMGAHNKSFFDLDLSKHKNKYDAVVGNPPYIEYQSIPDIDNAREHLKEYNPRGNKRPIYYNGTEKITKQSDIYTYFITKSVLTLKEGGRLGFIIPSKWLDTKYGEDLQKFLLDNTKLNSIIGFDSRTFEDALVDTVILLVEKCNDEQRRNENNVNIMYLKENMTPDEVLNNVKSNLNPSTGEVLFRDYKNLRFSTMKQETMINRCPEELGKYLMPMNKSIQKSMEDKMLKLSELGEISSGLKTGADKFFFLDDEDMDMFDISDRFIKKCVKSNRYIDGNVATEKSSDYKYLFDVSDFLEENALLDKSLEEIKDSLVSKGYDQAVKYIEWGESQGYNTNAKPSRKDIWFLLDDTDTPNLFIPASFHKDIYTIWNKDNFVANYRLYPIRTNSEIDDKAIFAITNSSFFSISTEVFGRKEGDGALSLMVYESERCLVPDIRDFSDNELLNLRELAEEMINQERNREDIVEDIDQTIIDALSMDINPSDAIKSWDSIMKQRTESTDDVKSMISNSSTYFESELDDWVNNEKYGDDNEDETSLEDFI